eukprot:14439012-Alexandrium_andersonii.AAC.1
MLRAEAAVETPHVEAAGEIPHVEAAVPTPHVEAAVAGRGMRQQAHRERHTGLESGGASQH